MAFLESLANTGIFNEEWNDWKNVFESRLKQNLLLFNPSKSSSTLENGLETKDGFPSSISESEKMLFFRIINFLYSNFSSHPPHTVQRLAELLLMPTLHYNTIQKYLRAVTSTTMAFKVSETDPCDQIINHNDSSAPNLTPIPWAYTNHDNTSENI
ncbi:hypothetical protein PCANB_002237 [Pneumocystis canis]|nr:hypothetical protein PCANB_002237 [Pneumocystis canis]